MRIIQWILDNLFAVFIIAGVLAQLLQAIRGKKAEQEQARPDAPEDDSFGDPELAERTRRIREDIQRKIAERQRGGTPPALPREEPVAFEPVSPFEEEPPPLREVIAREASRPAAAAHSRWEQERAAEILEQQAAMAERLRQLQEMKEAAARRAAFEAKTVSPVAQARQQRRGELLGELRDPAALRRAFLMREVLGPPVGLR